ncbi:TetR/AcrR family transcriptional regulator [Streptomonospora nanhaiensis]|uniref:AcrR family transcriptional regulator n=1 Tax=Streptomonospora nanhaiensis TaxID=1323731 RepID=A0A853BRM5_9ACTN|nr:TetR/AcrR family transcriptional regulator [Streptomonospora nanhaiensis]MBV2367199.1 TetR/AcrR family transcriptional regulator [Streptomonospora nanhaiensis]MBX9391141.1 TetR/AcrR family transcriptional regulator [Streptomonospora nanhaiensis]NYI97640.1 AcrR family transcriptional regulator [Streptomonospora nanhaiensis]
MRDASQSPEAPNPAPAPRRRRSDAERNRQALLDAARAALTDGEESFSLEGVARAAGVGIGTLYRHFPTREALVTSAYEAQVEDLLAQGGRLLEALPPREALRRWLDEFARFVSTKHGMLDALRLGMVEATTQHDVINARERMAAAIAPILAAGARDGSLRADVQPSDVVLLAAGSLMPVQVEAAQSERLLGLIMDALRPD